MRNMTNLYIRAMDAMYQVSAAQLCISFFPCSSYIAGCLRCKGLHNRPV